MLNCSFCDQVQTTCIIKKFFLSYSKNLIRNGFIILVGVSLLHFYCFNLPDVLSVVSYTLYHNRISSLSIECIKTEWSFFTFNFQYTSIRKAAIYSRFPDGIPRNIIVSDSNICYFVASMSNKKSVERLYQIAIFSL